MDRYMFDALDNTKKVQPVPVGEWQASPASWKGALSESLLFQFPLFHADEQIMRCCEGGATTQMR